MARAAPATSAERKPAGMLWGRLGALLRPFARANGHAAKGNWASHKTAGKKAYREGDYEEAERQFSAALKQVEPLGSGNPRVAATLNNLALVYKKQAKFGKAEICLRRALRIYESVRPDHVHVAMVLQNLAALYQAQGKAGDAEALIKRAKAIIDNGVG